MDSLDLFLINMHRLLGHDKTAFYLGVPPGCAGHCLLCRYEETGDDFDRLAIATTLMGVR